MDINDLNELHYITPTANLPSILERGILSNRLAKSLDHRSVAMAEIQDIRTGIRVPGGRLLHDYANLYFNARNPMMSKRQGEHRSLCVVRVSTGVLELPDAVITDSNAASRYRRWGPSPEGLAMIDRERVFTEWWTRHDDQIERWRHTAQMCAEALIPDSVPPSFIMGAYVSNLNTLSDVRKVMPGLLLSVNRYLFFNGPKEAL